VGLWEDAQQKHQQHLRDIAERQGYEDRKRQADQERVASQNRAIAEFIDAMNRLGIRPTRHRFWRYTTWPKIAQSRHGVTGWALNSPRRQCEKPNYVVTPDGELYEMSYYESLSRKPIDLAEPWYTTNYDDASRNYLSDYLETCLIVAMRDR
jgi:hypothetical protein